MPDTEKKKSRASIDILSGVGDRVLSSIKESERKRKNQPAPKPEPEKKSEKGYVRRGIDYLMGWDD